MEDVATKEIGFVSDDDDDDEVDNNGGDATHQGSQQTSCLRSSSNGVAVYILPRLQ